MAFQLEDSKLLRSQCLINNRWTAGTAEQRMKVDNPATGETVGEVPNLNEAEVTEAVDCAHQAFLSWRQQPAAERADCLYRWYQLMMEHQDDLATIMTTEQGKPLEEAKGEVAYAAGYFRWFAEEAPRLYGTIIPGRAPGEQIQVLKEPVGVCASITPWNFPLAMLARKAAAALAAGCTMVAKPAGATPFSALAMAELAVRAGFPEGVFNVITGKSQTIGQVFTQNPKVKKLSFTGSTDIGRQLMRQAADNVQKLSLELGGNAPFIVFEDADLDQAVQGLMGAKFRNTGQTCVCVNRLFVQRGCYDRLLDKLAEAMDKLVVGDGFDPKVNQSALINHSAVEKYHRHLQDALDQGAEVVLGGEVRDQGNYVVPTLLKNAHCQMQFAQEETFGPLLAAIPFDTEEEAVTMANDTPYGLAAYFYSLNPARITRVSAALEAGMVGVNDTAISNPAAPFGGVKASGMGREGSLFGLDDYVNVKYVLLGALQ